MNTKARTHTGFLFFARRKVKNIISVRKYVLRKGNRRNKIEKA